jgi:UDP-N-acetylmuramoyl-L-alanyl-D-glutamate--2,6-diaminopimelate ligase
LIGRYNVHNALAAIGAALELGIDLNSIERALSKMRPVPGRMELMDVWQDFHVYVDYAHTEDALRNVLMTVSELTKGRLICVFGCGGDRDKGKRPLMGAAAAKFANRVIVTDDNPRSEDAAAIRKEALAGCPGAREIGDRAEAIRAGIAALGEGDVLVIAGKGHESGQIVGKIVHPFSDRDEAIKAALSLGGRAAERQA